MPLGSPMASLFLRSAHEINRSKMSTAAPISTSVPKQRKEEPPIGYRQFLAKVTSPSSGFTVRPKPRFRKAGSQETLRRSSDRSSVSKSRVLAGWSRTHLEPERRSMVFAVPLLLPSGASQNHHESSANESRNRPVPDSERTQSTYCDLVRRG